MRKNILNRKRALVSIVVIVLLVLAGVGYFVYSKILEKGISNRVKNLYELANPGTIIEIIDVKNENGIYKVLMKGTDVTGANYREVYLTKNGRLLTENVILVKESINQMEKMRDFIDCLDEKEVRIYGLSNQTATLLQINTLGKYSVKLYIPCDNRLEECAKIGLQELPSVVFNNTAYPGVKTVQWLEIVTGCTLG